MEPEKQNGKLMRSYESSLIMFSSKNIPWREEMKGTVVLLSITGLRDQSKAKILSNQQADDKSEEITTVYKCMNSYTMLAPQAVLEIKYISPMMQKERNETLVMRSHSKK